MACCTPKQGTKVDLERQTVVLPGPERIHVSALNPACQDNFKMRYFSVFEDVHTLYDAIRRGLRVSNDGQCLGWRPQEDEDYHWLKYSVVINRAVNFGRGLQHLGLKIHDIVGIYSKSRVEWTLVEQGLISFSMISVALYDTLGLDACRHIINETQVSAIVIENEKQLVYLLEGIPNLSESVKIFVYMDDIPADTKALAVDNNVELHSFEEVEKMGAAHKNSYPEKPPRPDDTATINYTSGTLGTPKGVVVAHRNLVASASGSFAVVGQLDTQINPTDVAISFLPLAHIYERMLHVVYYCAGASVGFFRGDVTKLADDMRSLQPTILPCVPRLLNRVHDKIMAGVSHSKFKSWLLRYSVRKKEKKLARGILSKSTIWDTIVLKKIRKSLGGRTRLVISGGAPINGDIIQFFRCALGCNVIEGYGQTESSGCLCVTFPHEVTADHIGVPTPACAIKLIDVSEMEYFSKDNTGEICIKGPLVCTDGYYKNPQLTEETFDGNGWLHSGDIGQWLPNGTLKIIDRKKNIFKLSQGEYVAPEKIEIIYARCPLVGQVFVYGNSLESYLVGVVVPDPEGLQKEYRDEKWDENDVPRVVQRLCRRPEVAKRVLEQMTKQGNQSGLKSFEQVKSVHLHDEPFSIENGLLTPTMKTRRPELKKLFRHEIKKLYEAGIEKSDNS